MKNMSAYHIVCRPPTDEYREGWERIFGKKENSEEPNEILEESFNHIQKNGCENPFNLWTENE